MEGFKTSIGNILLSEIGNMNDKWLSFKNEFMIAQDTHIPRIKINSKNKSNPKWFNNEIYQAIIDRKKAYKTDRTILENKMNYVSLQRHVKSLINKAKRNEEIRISNLAYRNPKEFYKYVKSRNPICSSIGPL
jgi:hypothetical protein